ncbi:hypothetical protein I7I48_01966 [Histoplasma ohiense]|nr:hypothetical protein I7I48_01966 [Histoplasma ohiense (nom. inval.)]
MIRSSPRCFHVAKIVLLSRISSFRFPIHLCAVSSKRSRIPMDPFHTNSIAEGLVVVVEEPGTTGSTGIASLILYCLLHPLLVILHLLDGSLTSPFSTTSR